MCPHRCVTAVPQQCNCCAQTGVPKENLSPMYIWHIINKYHVPSDITLGLLPKEHTCCTPVSWNWCDTPVLAHLLHMSFMNLVWHTSAISHRHGTNSKFKFLWHCCGTPENKALLWHTSVTFTCVYHSLLYEKSFPDSWIIFLPKYVSIAHFYTEGEYVLFPKLPH